VDDEAEAPDEEKPLRLAIVGRPNVGKSTLVNRLLDEERQLVGPEPGITRDAIMIPWTYEGTKIELVDTAGLRRKRGIEDRLEHLAVGDTLNTIRYGEVAVLVLDGDAILDKQDLTIARHIIEEGRALVIAVNKWERLPESERDVVKRTILRKLNFLDFARLHFISALEGRGVVALLKSVDDAYAAATARLPTPRLSRTLAAAVTQQPPPRSGLTRPKLRYAHQGGSNPPRIIVHGNALEHVTDGYRRYLERFFRDAFKLEGTPLRIEFRSGANPYARGVRARR
jgi:GTP-binding protein